MGSEIRHYVGYHNTEKMGGPIDPAKASRVLTNKSVLPIDGNMVWMIAGEGQKPRRYSLVSVFRATETGNTGDDNLRHFAQGPGQCFDPPIELSELDWFDDLSRSMNRFQFGVQELKDENLVGKLVDVSGIESLP